MMLLNKYLNYSNSVYLCFCSFSFMVIKLAYINQNLMILHFPLIELMHAFKETHEHLFLTVNVEFNAILLTFNFSFRNTVSTHEKRCQTLNI